MVTALRRNPFPFNPHHNVVGIFLNYILYTVSSGGPARFNILVTIFYLTCNIFYAIIRESKGGIRMNVYIKNSEGEQTVRYLPLYKAIYLRLLVFARYRKDERPIVRFVI